MGPEVLAGAERGGRCSAWATNSKNVAKQYDMDGAPSEGGDIMDYGDYPSALRKRAGMQPGQLELPVCSPMNGCQA